MNNDYFLGKTTDKVLNVFREVFRFGLVIFTLLSPTLLAVFLHLSLPKSSDLKAINGILLLLNIFLAVPLLVFLDNKGLL